MLRNAIRAQGRILTRGVATSASSAELLDIGERHVTKGLGRLVKGIMKKGEGSYVFMDDGRRLLDFTCGIGVANLGILNDILAVCGADSNAGHCHPKISKAAADQCMSIVHAQVR